MILKLVTIFILFKLCHGQEEETSSPDTPTSSALTEDPESTYETENPDESSEIDSLYDQVYEQFLYNEFDYEDYLSSPLTHGQLMVPFKDVSNDTYWRTGRLPFKTLRPYVEVNLTSELEGLETKPWLSIKKIKEELARCIHYRYGTVSEQEFVYDKEMYGWMNIMKFTCFKTGDTLVYGMGFGRFRFRLKEILLRKEKSYWGRSSRDVTMRDMQKIMEHFSRLFAEKIKRKVMIDMKKLFPHQKGDLKEPSRLINLPNEVVNEMFALFPDDDITEIPHQEKEHTFSFASIPIIIRIAVLDPNEVQPVVDIYFGDLSEDSQTAVEMCAKKFCTATDQVSEVQTYNSEHRAFFKDRSLRYDVNEKEVLIAYASSRPECQLAKRKKKKNDRIIDIKQEFDEETTNIWYDMLDSQVAHNFYMQHASIIL